MAVFTQSRGLGMALKRELEQTGAATVLITTSVEALLGLVRSAVDVVVVDRPGHAGHELVERLREEAAATRPRILLISARRVARRHLTQVDAHITAPVRVLDVADGVGQLLARSPRARSGTRLRAERRFGHARSEVVHTRDDDPRTR